MFLGLGEKSVGHSQMKGVLSKILANNKLNLLESLCYRAMPLVTVSIFKSALSGKISAIH